MIFAVVFVCSGARADDRGDGELAARLRAECDALLRMAVQKRYGLAWPAPDGGGITLPRGANLVSMDPLSTPSAGLVLLWAGKSLGDERYLTAAHQVARGIAASLHHSGRVPARVVFDTRPRPRDGAAVAFPDRAPTYAGLALMLTAVDQGNDDALVRSAATRAATFLTRQQAATGLWPVLVSENAEANDSAADRQVPLTDTDYRDATLAVLYAYEVLGTVPLRKSVESAVEQLLEMRITRSRSAAGLWHGAYTIAGQPLPRENGAFAVDTLASRNALHTLFAVHVTLGGDATQAAIEEAANRLVALRYANGEWDRVYPLTNDEVIKKPDGPDSGPVFADPAAPPKSHGDFGIPPLLTAIGQMQQLGRAAYLNQLAKRLPHKQDLAQTLCGLGASPLLPNLPATREEAQAYADAHREQWKALDSSGVAGVETRIRRIHTLLIRRHVERLLAADGGGAPSAAASQ